MSEPKRHHVVPEFYLKRFARDDVVELVERDNPQRVVSTGVSSALAQKHFYSIDTDEGRDTTIEKMLATEVEAPAAKAIARVIDQGRASTFPGLRTPIAVFLAFQSIRGPATRHSAIEFVKANAKEILTSATPEVFQNVLARQGEPISLDEARTLVATSGSDQYRLEVPSEANAHLSLALEATPALLANFLERSWTVLDFATPCLLTGDEPLALIGHTFKPGEALGTADAPQLAFPTDPWHALILHRPDQERWDRRDTGTQRMADIINTHVAFGCHRFLVRYPGTDPLRGRVLPKKAPPVMSMSDGVFIQPRVSIRGRRAWLRRRPDHRR